MKPSIELFTDADELASGAAQRIVDHSRKAISTSGRFTIGLSGGSTPKRLYKLLADENQIYRDQMSWDRIHFFWTDERHVPPDDSDSNYRMVNEAMLSHLPVPASNIHRMLAEKINAQGVADDYEAELTEFFDFEPDDVPRIDLVLLGMGADGHTASLFPGSTVLQEKDRLVVAPWVEKLKVNRLTMTLPVLNNADAVLFLVSGSDKAEMLTEVLEGPDSRYPAQLIKPVDGQLTWLVDKDAGVRL